MNKATQMYLVELNIGIPTNIPIAWFLNSDDAHSFVTKENKERLSKKATKVGILSTRPVMVRGRIKILREIMKG